MKAIGSAKHGDIDLSSFLPGNAGNMLKMFDTMTNSGILEKAMMAKNYFDYVTSLIQDVVLFVFANFLMDSMLMMFQKKFITKGLPEDIQIEL